MEAREWTEGVEGVLSPPPSSSRLDRVGVEAAVAVGGGGWEGGGSETHSYFEKCILFYTLSENM